MSKSVVYSAKTGQIVQRKTVSEPGRAIHVQKLTLSDTQRAGVSRALQAGRSAQQGKK